jgi:hypothetical protein
MMPVSIPKKYAEMRASMPIDEFNFGVGGLRLLKLDEIDDGQIGYLAARDRSPLSSAKDGSWKPDWIVIGYDTACGDPLIMDTSDPALPVLHDFNGQGTWNPTPVSLSIESFVASLYEFARLASGRSTPVARDANPVTDAERKDFLLRISELNAGRADLEFWGALLEC